MNIKVTIRVKMTWDRMVRVLLFLRISPWRCVGFASLTSLLVRGGRSPERSDRFTPGGWVDPTVGLNVMSRVKVLVSTGDLTPVPVLFVLLLIYRYALHLCNFNMRSSLQKNETNYHSFWNG